MAIRLYHTQTAQNFMQESEEVGISITVQNVKLILLIITMPLHLSILLHSNSLYCFLRSCVIIMNVMILTLFISLIAWKK